MMSSRRSWVKDDNASACMRCQKTFTFTFRKHHCRQCGYVVCDPCSTKKALAYGYKKPVRVCVPCFQHLVMNPTEDSTSKNLGSDSTNDGLELDPEEVKEALEQDAARLSAVMNEMSLRVVKEKVGSLDLATTLEAGPSKVGTEKKGMGKSNGTSKLSFKWPDHGAVSYNSATFTYYIRSTTGPEIQMGLALYMRFKLTWEPYAPKPGFLLVRRSAGEVINRLNPQERTKRPDVEALSFLVDGQGDFHSVNSDLGPLLSTARETFLSQISDTVQLTQDALQRLCNGVVKSTRIGIERDLRQLWQSMVQAWKSIPNAPEEVQPKNVVGQLGQLFGKNVWELQQSLTQDPTLVKQQVARVLEDATTTLPRAPHESEEDFGISCSNVAASHWMSVLTDHRSLRPFMVKTDHIIKLTLQSKAPLSSSLASISKSMSVNSNCSDSTVDMEVAPVSLVSRTLTMLMFFFDDFPQLLVAGQAPRTLGWDELLTAYIDECSAKYEAHVHKAQAQASQASAIGKDSP